MPSEKSSMSAPVHAVVMRGLIVQLEDGVFLAPWKGDPGRTLDIAQARVFTTEKEARKAIAWARRFRDFQDARITYA